MIDADSKTNSFLEAIEKYAEQQKQAMRDEIEAFREEQLKHANEEGTAAAFAYIQKEKSEYKASLAKENSLKETEIKRELFEKRNKMVNEVFEKAEKKLLDFSKSKKYEAYMQTAAKNIADHIEGKKAVLYVAEKDKPYISGIKKLITNCEVLFDPSIKIGGIRCFCSELSVVLDETLDSKFEARKRIFVETSGFTVA